MTDEQIIWSLTDIRTAALEPWIYETQDGEYRLTGPTSRPRYIHGAIQRDQVQRLIRAGKIETAGSSSCFRIAPLDRQDPEAQ